MHRYDLTQPLTWAECQEQDRAALAAGVACYHDGSTVFLRYDDVTKLLSHPDAQLGYGTHQEQAGITEGLLHRFVTESFLAAPDADHARLRSLVSRAFTPRALEQLRVVARRTAEEALAGLQPGVEHDVWGQIAAPVPALVMCSLLGLPPSYASELNHLVRTISVGLMALDDQAALREPAERALERLYAYAGELALERRSSSGDDVISVLAVAEGEGRLTRTELLSMVSILIFTGIDTTRGLIGLGLYTLAEHPEALAKLNANPELATSATEEILRFANPAPWAARFAVRPIECAGQILEPGTTFVLSLGAAGLDPSQFEDPLTFNIERPGQRHLAFGRGRHACIGAALARLQGQEMLRALAARRLHLEVVGETPRFVRAGATVEPVGSFLLGANA